MIDDKKQHLFDFIFLFHCKRLGKHDLRPLAFYT